WQGTVVLDIAMLADGTIGAVKIAESSGYPLLDAAAQKAVKKWQHIPVQHNGVPVARRANLPIRFRLD
ncbi:MAG: energy transducer TonB, partial [Candidatus Tectomicrobia bacterium]